MTTKPTDGLRRIKLLISLSVVLATAGAGAFALFLVRSSGVPETGRQFEVIPLQNRLVLPIENESETYLGRLFDRDLNLIEDGRASSTAETVPFKKFDRKFAEVDSDASNQIGGRYKVVTASQSALHSSKRVIAFASYVEEKRAIDPLSVIQAGDLPPNAEYVASAIYLGWSAKVEMKSDRKSLREELGADVGFANLSNVSKKTKQHVQFSLDAVGIAPRQRNSLDQWLRSKDNFWKAFEEFEYSGTPVPIFIEYTPVRDISNYKRYLVSARLRLADKDADGKRWDKKGKRSKPDPQVELMVDGKRVDVCKKDDVSSEFTCSFRSTAFVRPGASIRLDVSERDKTITNPIGSARLRDPFVENTEMELETPAGVSSAFIRFASTD